MIIRDLTLRSAASFGSFHLIRLLYDEYMFYLVEHKYDLYVRSQKLSHILHFIEHFTLKGGQGDRSDSGRRDDGKRRHEEH